MSLGKYQRDLYLKISMKEIKNKFLIIVTNDVLKFPKFIDVNESQLQNKSIMSVHWDESKFDIIRPPTFWRMNDKML